jgi:hypothetical protein
MQLSGHCMKNHAMTTSSGRGGRLYLAWPEADDCYNHSCCCREDQNVVGGIAGSRGTMKEEEEVEGGRKWKQEKGLIFFQTLASDFFSISLFAIFILLFYLYFGKK